MKPSFLSELRRRNVIRMAGLYIVGAWLIVQVAETVLPAFDIPNWVLRATIILLAIGFIPAIVFSWVFELTPEGLKREGEVDRSQSIVDHTARKLDVTVIVLLLCVGGLLLWQKLGSESTFVPAPEAGRMEPASKVDSDPNFPARGGGQLVAVLPFRNRSAREEDAYFAEGIHDDLLTQLSRIASLKVISRTSMMRYRDTEKSITEIAAELGAGVLLEGAVQRAGDQVRITVQLIDGATDVHLWAQSYDRVLSTENLFAIQADIAKAVADAMKVVLSPDEAGALVEGSTDNLKAYEFFLRGKLLATPDGLNSERLEGAIAAFNDAIELDPSFADAYAHKARAHLAGFWYVLGAGAKSQRAAAEEALAKAHQLAPDSIETLLAEAYYAYWGKLDYASAEAVLGRLLDRVPGNAEAWAVRGFVARRDGRFEDALAAFRRVLEIDPVELNVLVSLGDTLGILGREASALETLKLAAKLGADERTTRVFFREAMGDAEGAWAAVDGPGTALAKVAFRAALLTRDPSRIAMALSPTLWPEDRRSPPDFPEAYALAQAEGELVVGDPEKAVRLLREIQLRLDAREVAYPGGWMHNGYYFPCDLPGMLGDLEGVRAAERDYIDNGLRDAWGAGDYENALAVAFARAGDTARALDYLEGLAKLYGPNAYLRLSITPGLDSLRNESRYLALKTGYERWAAEQAR